MVNSYPVSPCVLDHVSDSARGYTAALFAQQLRTATVLAAETDVARLVIPALAGELSRARLQKCPLDQASRKHADNQVDVQQQGQQMSTKEVAQAHVTKSRRDGHKVDVECLRERTWKRPVPPGNGVGGGVCNNEKKEEEEWWAPPLAVFRAVDAVLSGGGRPRMSFVRPGADGAVGRM